MKFPIFVVLFALSACGNSKPDSNPNPPILIIDTPDLSQDLAKNDIGDPKQMDMGVEEDIIEDVVDIPTEDIAIRLASLPNVINVQELSSSMGKRRFYVDFQLDLDHFSAQSPTFTQRGILYFVDDKAPTVLVTTGYGLPDVNGFQQLGVGATDILNGNQFVIGHRFFTGAIPAVADQHWELVNIEQSAEDTHEILQSMRSVLTQKWAGTGWSKGGMTILFQEYFYPEDLELALPMVAPISFGLKDERYPPFLAQIGTQECRDRLDDSMIGALSRSSELAEEFNPASDFEREQWAAQIEYSVFAFPWSYWQYYGLSSCSFIPPGDAAAADLVSFFVYNQLPKITLKPSTLPRPIDPEEADLVAYTYQALSQLGFQDLYATGQLQRMVDLGFLTPEGKTQIESASYEFGDFPWAQNPGFDPQVMVDVDTWLRTQAKDIFAIYGQHDPWSGGMITLNPANNSEVFVAPGTSHGTFLVDLEASDYNRVRSRILELDSRDRTRSFQKEVKAPSKAQRAILLKLLKQEL